MEDTKKPEEENKTPRQLIAPPEVSKDSSVIPKTDTNNEAPPIMEVHHHPQLNHKPKRWKEYILEFIMIVLAVTTGFFAESLRENLGDRAKEKQVITSLVKCLASDTTQLTNMINSNKLIVTYLDSLYMLKNADLTAEENIRKFYL